MKISKLIELLETAQAKHGDIEAEADFDCDISFPSLDKVYINFNRQELIDLRPKQLLTEDNKLL